MFRSLRKREETAFKKQLYASALVAADYRNANRGEGGRIVDPLDFIFGKDEEETKRDEAKRNIASMFAVRAELGGEMQPGDIEKMKTVAITELKKQGFEDAEELYREVFPA